MQHIQPTVLSGFTRAETKIRNVKNKKTEMAVQEKQVVVQKNTTAAQQLIEVANNSSVKVTTSDN